jgi:hypothetical protein
MVSTARGGFVVACLTSLVGIGPATAIGTVGVELQVNTYTTEHQGYPAVAMSADGDFVVVWESADQDGSDYGVFAQLFASSGAPLGGEFQVNTYTYGAQRYPAVASEPDGDFVVVWQSLGQDGYNETVIGQRFASSGARVAGEFQINTYTFHSQYAPNIAMNATAAFVVVWTSSGGQDGDYRGIFAQRFSGGVPVGVEFQIDAYTEGSPRFQVVAIDSDGDFVVAWEDLHRDGSENGVFARRFSSAGTPVGDDFQVNTTAYGNQGEPAVGMASSGAFVVVWEAQNDQDGDGRAVIAQRFTSSGDLAGGEFQINTYTPGVQTQPSLAMRADGEFLVTWVSLGEQDGNGNGVFAQRFASSGTPLGIELQVNSYTTGDQSYPTAALAADGDFVITWESSDQDGESGGVFAQLFGAVTAPLDVDGDGETEALTDGLLVLRRLFGFTGATLVTGAVDLANCTRCDATAIETHLASIASLLDIDLDGTAEPLTDGLLALRWLFGFGGTTLVTGAVDTMNCMRCSPDQIGTYIEGLAD